eukprot:g68205.t1
MTSLQPVLGAQTTQARGGGGVVGGPVGVAGGAGGKKGAVGPPAPVAPGSRENGATTPNSKKARESKLIVNVWAHNLKEELNRIMEIVDDYPYIAMDTEFPGVVARPVGCFKDSHDFHYQTLKCNVDLLKIIQLGLTFCNEDGEYLPGTCTWQFNFKFSLTEDMYAQDSIDLLAKSGIDFREHDAKGINVSDFGAVLTTSGIVLNEDVRWISFHSGYDYGYLLKVLTSKALPKEESEFFQLIRDYFPCLYDIKYLMISCENLSGGLQKVAETLKIERIGPQHQAGSDALLTASTFFKMRKLFFDDEIDDDKYMGVLFGLGQNLRPKNEKRQVTEFS